MEGKLGSVGVSAINETRADEKNKWGIEEDARNQGELV
jgi:hypothetical protein